MTMTGGPDYSQVAKPIKAPVPLSPKAQGILDGTYNPGQITYGNGYGPSSPANPPVGYIDGIGMPGAPGYPGSAPAGPAGPQLPPGVTDRESATSVFRTLLRNWGFNDSDTGALSEWAWQQILNGSGEAEVENGLYEHDIFKREYPEYEARRKSGLPISVEDILGYRQTVADVMKYFDIAQFYDGDGIKDITRKLITNGVSASEATDRVSGAFAEIDRAPDEAQAIFGEWYGVSSRQALAAYFLSPDHAMPTLERQVRMAEISGAGRSFGVNVNAARSEDLARMGVSSTQAYAGFNQLDQITPLFEETFTEGVDYTKEGVGVDATFGLAPGAQTRLQRRLDERRAAFAGGGGAYVTESGVRGL